MGFVAKMLAAPFLLLTGVARMTDGRRAAYSGAVAVVCKGRRASCYPLRGLHIGD